MAWQGIHYTWQRLNRRRKPQESMNKLKEAEFLYMLEGKFYGGAELLEKKSKIRQIAGFRNLKLDIVDNKLGTIKLI